MEMMTGWVVGGGGRDGSGLVVVVVMWGSGGDRCGWTNVAEPNVVMEKSNSIIL